jgi:hypothetical protein
MFIDQTKHLKLKKKKLVGSKMEIYTSGVLREYFRVVLGRPGRNCG